MVEKKRKQMTLSLIYNPPNILLGMKKIGFGKGRWNGYGGKVKPGETIEQAAMRETEEESGIKVGKLEKIGIIDFEFKTGVDEILEVHFYRALEYTGKPIETEEMRSQWFHQEEIPYDNMWPDDRCWMPLFLKGLKFQGRIYFENQDKILENQLEEVEELAA